MKNRRFLDISIIKQGHWPYDYDANTNADISCSGETAHRALNKVLNQVVNDGARIESMDLEIVDDNHKIVHDYHIQVNYAAKMVQCSKVKEYQLKTTMVTVSQAPPIIAFGQTALGALNEVLNSLNDDVGRFDYVSVRFL